MAADEPTSTTTPIPMIICPTTHNDWDWQMTFEQYYETAFSNYGVRGILDSVTTIFEGTTTPDTQFCFSYAEVGFLRRYLNDRPEKAAVLKAAGSRFCLLGGGITSPDNQTCHGEVFIRNYLTGHEYLRSVGLIDNVFFVAWLPDDFGHDPQLPVLIEALGMKAIGLSRVPGSPQPKPCHEKQHAAHDARARSQLLLVGE
jgi:alpha-mannosidase